MLVRMATIKKSVNNKCWRGCGEKGTLLYCWWECKLVQPLWRTVWIFLKKNWNQNSHMTQQSHCWAYTLRKPELKETHLPQYSLQHCLQQLESGSNRYLSADEWMRNLWYISTMEYYSAFKKSTFESVLLRWMKLEPIIQSEVSQKGKHQYSILTHIYGFKKMGMITIHVRQQKRHRCIEQSFGLRGRGRGWDDLGERH